jgi:hypothetical protein
LALIHKPHPLEEHPGQGIQPSEGDIPMAVAFILDFPGGTRDQYDQVMAKMDLGGKLPPGALFHAAGSFEGGWRVIDVWEDAETFARFRDEKIMPYTQEVGLQPPQARSVEVDERKPGSGADAVLVQVVHMPGMDAHSFHAADDRILGPEHKPPPNCTFHVNGPDGDGWCVVDAWDSADARDRFLEERVRPAMADAPLQGPPVIEDLHVEATLRS